MENVIGFTPVITTISLQVLSNRAFMFMWGKFAKKKGNKIIYPDPANPVGESTEKWRGELILKPFEQKVGLYIRGHSVRPALVAPLDFRVIDRMEATLEFLFFLTNDGKKCFEAEGIFS